MAESLGSVEKSGDSTANKHPSDASSGEVLPKRSSDGRSDDEIDKHHREASKDEGPSGSRSDSEAETDESGASRDSTANKHPSDASSDASELSENFKELKLESTEGVANGNETPPQMRRGSVPETRNAKKRLDYDDQSHKDGKWLENHRWEGREPSLESIDTTVEQSTVYTVSNTWLRSNKKVDLEKIYSGLPTFINEMKGPPIRKELEDILNRTQEIGSTNTKFSPHVFEIVHKYDPPKDQKSRPKPLEYEKFKAFTLPPPPHPHQPAKDSYWFLDCEYMLKMYSLTTHWHHSGSTVAISKENALGKLTLQKTIKDGFLYHLSAARRLPC